MGVGGVGEVVWAMPERNFFYGEVFPKIVQKLLKKHVGKFVLLSQWFSISPTVTHNT